MKHFFCTYHLNRKEKTQHNCIGIDIADANSSSKILPEFSSSMIIGEEKTSYKIQVQLQ